jgi:hypothetical protein
MYKTKISFPLTSSRGKYDYQCPQCEKVYKTPLAIKELILVKHEGTATQKHSFGTYSK